MKNIKTHSNGLEYTTLNSTVRLFFKEVKAIVLMKFSSLNGMNRNKIEITTEHEEPFYLCNYASDMEKEFNFLVKHYSYKFDTKKKGK